MSNVKIVGEIKKIVWKSPDESNLTHILQVKRFDNNQTLSVIGKVLSCSIGDKIEAEGVISETQYGKQLKAQYIHVEMPVTLTGIVKFLHSETEGVGEKLAQTIVDKFGKQTLDIIKNNPQKLKEIKGLSQSKIDNLRIVVNKGQMYRDITIFLLEVCEFTPDRITSIIEKYEEDTISIIKENPFQLMKDFDRISFKKADSIAIKLGVPKNSPERISRGINYILDQETSYGNCAVEENILFEKVEELLEIEISDKIKEIYKKMIVNKEIYKEVISNKWYIYPKDIFEAEALIAQCLNSLTETKIQNSNIADDFLLKVISRVEEKMLKNKKIDSFEFSDEQKQAILKAYKNKITIITGGPGTGKTTILEGLINLMYLNTADGVSLAQAAPTGKAAKRMEEKTGFQAMTIHKLLGIGGVDNISAETEGLLPYYNIKNKLEHKFFIIDESSMIDTILFSQLLAAIPNNAQLVLVGDIDQLPSIGPGSILKDLINTNKITVVRLVETRRQAKGSKIIMNAKEIMKGNMPEITNDLNEDFFMFDSADNNEIIENIKELTEFKLKEFVKKQYGGIVDSETKVLRDFDPLKDLQILSPMNKGEVGNNEINSLIQNLINKNTRCVRFGGREFREGDKVIQLKNKAKHYIFNGDIGFITEILNTKEELEILKKENGSSKIKTVPVLEVWFEGTGTVKLTHEDLEDLRLAYSISIHKSQGSEYPIVIIPVSLSHFNMLERKLFYTGITRAKKMLILVGQRKALYLATQNNKSEDRITGLKERLSNDLIQSL